MAATFEEILFLLWRGRRALLDEARAMADELGTYRALPESVLDLLRMTPEYARPVAALRTAVSMLACADPEPDEHGREAQELKAKKLLAQLPTIVAAQHRIGQDLEPLLPDSDLSHAGNYLYMLTGRPPDSISTEALDALLGLYAQREHATGAPAPASCDFYSGVVIALSCPGSADGSGLEDVMRMLMAAGSADRVPAYVEQELAIHRPLPGFGPEDQAAEQGRSSLIALTGGRGQWLAVSQALERAVRQRAGLRPSLDFYAAPALYHLGFPLELFTNVVASARAAAWTARALERYAEPAALESHDGEYIGPPLTA